MELNRLYNMDCMEAMRDMPDKSFDLAIVDPPYGIWISNNMGRRRASPKSEYKKIDWDNDAPPKEYFAELERVSKTQIIFGANYFLDRIPTVHSCWIVWDKLFSDEVSFASFEMALVSNDTPCKRIKLSSVQTDRIHPTQKPVELYMWILAHYANPGDKILDTHAGSASSLIACHKMGYEYVGYEIDKDYYKAALARLETETSQISIGDI